MVQGTHWCKKLASFSFKRRVSWGWEDQRSDNFSGAETEREKGEREREREREREIWAAFHFFPLFRPGLVNNLTTHRTRLWLFHMIMHVKDFYSWFSFPVKDLEKPSQANKEKLSKLNSWYVFGKFSFLHNTRGWVCEKEICTEKRTSMYFYVLWWFEARNKQQRSANWGLG